MFDQEIKYFIDNQERLVQQYGGKVIVIEGSNIIGVFDNSSSAYEDVERKGLLGKVMIQKCVAGKDAYTVSIATFGVVE